MFGRSYIGSRSISTLTIVAELGPKWLDYVLEKRLMTVSCYDNLGRRRLRPREVVAVEADPEALSKLAA